MTDDKTNEARRGLLSSLKGKAKEVAGAVTGNESLITEGQLQQTEAQSLREANAKQAIADAESADATAKIQAEHEKAAKGERVVTRQAAAQKAAATAQKNAQSERVEAKAARQKAIDTAVVEQQADLDAQAAAERAAAERRSATRNETAAKAEYAKEAESASAADTAAKRARAEAAKLGKDAGIA